VSRRRFVCLDCKMDTGQEREHYYLRLDVWLQAHNSKTGMLCIGCVETRLGRTLTPADFTEASINNPKVVPMSARLLSRIAA
jgi:hypothetical protein